jgi:hypothetical protein
MLEDKPSLPYWALILAAWWRLGVTSGAHRAWQRVANEVVKGAASAMTVAAFSDL